MKNASKREEEYFMAPPGIKLNLITDLQAIFYHG